MAAEENDNEPVKLTVKLRSEITEQEPLEYTVLRPAKPIVEPEEPIVEPEDEERFEETMESTDTANVQERKPEREKARISKIMRKSPTRNEPEGKPISQLQSELRKHSDARKKTDLAVKDIQKQLKDLLLVHHASIRDLQKQVTQMHRMVATIDSSKKSTRSMTAVKKTASSKKGKKTASSKKGKNNPSTKKSRKR